MIESFENQFYGRFLSAAVLRRVALFQLLAQTTNPYSQKELKDSLFINQKTLVNDLEKLTEDLSSYSSASQLAFTDGKYHLILHHSFSYSQFFLTYLNKSDTFLIMKELLINGSFDSIHFSRKNFLSISSVNNRLNEVKRILDDFSIKLVKKNIVSLYGDEKIIRYLSYLFFSLSSDFERIISQKKKKQSAVLVKKILQLSELQKSFENHHNLTLWISITLNRLDKIKTNPLQKQIAVDFSQDILYKKISHPYRQMLTTYQLSDKQSTLECQLFYQYILSFIDIYPNLNTNNLPICYQLALLPNEVTQFWFETYWTLFRFIPFPEDKATMYKKVAQLHFERFFFGGSNTLLLQVKTDTDKKEFMTQAAYMTELFYKKLRTRRKFQQITFPKEKVFPYYQAWIQRGLYRYFKLKPIKISILSIYDHVPKKYYLNLIKNHCFQHIELVDVFDASCELIITDQFYSLFETLNTPIFYWQMRPTERDLLGLKKELLHLIVKRMNQLVIH
ncbi:hypothetical protein RV11_GL000281 [Enterococcus phoeniculicola]|uniref:Mga helix-turn-helix domain-containing protein n=1 Tax=Enterococcus phoeniculicola ATCC BAA-412 TaxID=1158610 RepID=R3WQD2_9ENTE|nr:helix-turn-helix domain-containing protein [Enterococcus phoeniculicola]EOL44025.1 hypothetical protein UC3_01655 [Enterococcus phoeniculicola ATCC BAA-412]EOT75127.1 hypothetical protein I589_02727 [Enterococcus phoeniculicola ATCC BAA-412]OJG71575.1 hypothetical protein RV11_GL000281 [Enterococcus phoeniculicola]